MKRKLLLFTFIVNFLNIANAQFVQTFDSATTIPSGWNVINGGDTNTWIIGTPYNGPAFSGSNVAKIVYNETVAHNDYLVTPQITVTAGVNDRISFRVRNLNELYVEHFDVKLSTTNGNSATSFTTTLLADTAAPTEWTKITIDLTPFIGQSIYVGFRATSVNMFELYLDDIINDTAQCNYSAPTISSVILPTCTAAGSVTLSGLPPSGTWTLKSQYQGPNNTIITTTTGTGTTATVPISKSEQQDRNYIFKFIDETGCESPNTNYNQVIVIRKWYYFSEIESTYQDTNNDGITNVGDQILYNFIIHNYGDCTIPNCLIYYVGNYPVNTIQTFGTFNIASNSTLNLNATYNITQYDISNGCVKIGLGDSYPGYSSLYYDDKLLNTAGIRMNAFVDSNNNGIKELSEAFFPHGDFKYSITNGNGVINTVNSSNGRYLLTDCYLAPTQYDLSFAVSPVFSNFISSPTTYTGVNSTPGNGIVDYYFPVYYTNASGDLQVNTIGVGNRPRPGFEFTNRIIYINSFNSPISGTLNFTKDSLVTINSVSQSNVVNNANGFSYLFNFQPNEIGYIDVAMQVSLSAVVGNSLTNSTAVTIPANDVFPANNISPLTQTIVNSYDPNDKLESHGDKILISSFTSNDYLTYTINFENIGTANAVNIKITDDLSNLLDENSIIVVSSSHTNFLEKNASSLLWQFNGINLVPNGKGYVTFKIKPKPGYTVGTIIPNQAQIYFDYNSAIITNTCTTEFVNALNNKDLIFNGLQYFPNPVKNNLNIRNSYPINQIEINSILGQKMIMLKSDELQTEIDLSNLPSGIYFVKVKSEGSEKVFRIIKD